MSKRKMIHCLSVLLVGLVGLVPMQSQAGAITPPSGPLYVGASVTPLVMLDVTKDQNLYKKAFDDYTDLDGDGWADTTYDHTIDYYGYFDSYKCYSYASSKFSPVAASLSVDGYGNPIKPSDCSGNWHGNFLNWVTMSRMDAVRKLLYGGYRSTDTGSGTVLERAYIPTDSHAWAKYYNPYLARQMDTWPSHQSNLTTRYPDISTLTPFSSITQTPSAVTSTTSNSISGSQTSPQSKSFNVGSNTTQFAYGDQVLIEDAANASNYMIGAVSCVNGTGISMYNALVSSSNSCSSNEIKVVVENSVGTGTKTSWKIYNYTQSGLTFCNATPDTSSAKSQTSTAAPLMRVAKGNFSLWNANERWQCYWREDTTSPGESTTSLSGATRTNGNRAALTGLYASSIGPNKTTSSSGRIANGANGSSSDYTVRVDACVSAATIGNERCAQYPSGNYKPIGLLQYYGEGGLLKFGMMTGSYTKNKSGGTLRKNISNISDEINTSTDGTIKTTAPSTGSIINTVNKMRIWGYSYSDGTYAADSTGGSTFCTWGATNITEGTCLSWGNPMSEVYVESLRYLAGKTANSNFNVSSDVLSLSSPSWSDPISTSNYCAPLNVLVFNSAVNTYEHDSQMSCSSLGETGNTCDTTTTTNDVGTQEGINGNSWFVGNSGTTNNDICSSKSVTNFSDIYGVCPEGAGTEGSYLMAGPAYFAHVNRIRDGSTFSLPSTDTRSLKVSTYGIALASNTPKHSLTINGKRVTIMPQGRLVNSGYGSGSIVDWKIVCEIPVGADAATIASITKASAGRCSQAGTGAFYWNEEDSEQGGDYDQDMWGRVQYLVNTGTGTVAVTTDVIAQSTPYTFGFGYAISGTTKDGPHFHSGINNFSFTDSNAGTISGDLTHISSSSCNNCAFGDGATTATYTVATTTTNTVLQDPLWYAAKYGGFKDFNNNGRPDLVDEWDSLNANGSTTGCTSSGCDGVPDNFFLVTNPLYLEQALDSAFTAMLSESSASSVATNSTSLQTGSRIYQARFNSNDWSGQLRALALVASTGDIDLTVGAQHDGVVWDAGLVLNGQITLTSDTRTMITYGKDTNPKQGIPFTWSAINGQTSGTTMSTALNTNGLNTTSDSKGALRVSYLRGSQANEGKSSITFRTRTSTRLGDIVNSSPVYVGAPEAGWVTTDYKAYRTANLSRTPILYVGANDGMLHGFRTSDGQEVLAYVPGVFYNSSATSSNLSQLTNQTYGHKFYVDGTPMVNDIETGPSASVEWKTVLVGGLNWGGRAYYALDVSSPDVSGSNPVGFSEANAANILMWEFSNANDNDLGFTLNQPTYPPFKGISEQIVKMRNGKWAVVVGNGYNSDNGVAALFIFFLDRAKTGGIYSTTWTIGTHYIKLVADKQATSNFNGLSTPKPFSAKGDGIVDWIYAGDLNGNLWKFDVSSSSSASWGVANNDSPTSPTLCSGSNATATTPTTITCTPLYIAKDASNVRQPITTAPQVTRHPNGGVVVTIGTGKYLESTDTTSITSQTLYGVWDNGSNNAGNMTRSQLRQQSVVTTAQKTASGGVTNSYRLTTDYCITNTGTKSGLNPATNTDPGNTIPVCADDWTSAGAQKGWYMDLPTSGERVAYNHLLRNERVVVPTLIPSSVPCQFSGSSWLMELDALTGRRLETTPFDTDGNGLFDGSDKVQFIGSTTNYASGIMPAQGGILTTPTVIKSRDDPKKEYKYSSSSTGAVVKTAESASYAGRIAWREVVQ